METPNILKFPTKKQRRDYRKKLLSMRTAMDVTIVAAGVLLADLIVWIIKKVL